MTGLIAATVGFVGLHFLLSAARRPIVARTGRRLFLGFYSLIAIVMFVWMIVAYRAAPHAELWPHQAWSRWLAIAVMPFATILLVCGYFTPNPTAVGGEPVLARNDPAPGIFKVTRHPVLWAIALWAAVHLVANGTAAAFVFFGGLLVLALGGIAHIEAKRAGDPGWQRLTAASSVIPFVAAAEARARGWARDIGFWRLALAIAVYFVFLLGHRDVIGVPLIY